MKRDTRRIRLYFVGACFALATVVLWGRLVQVQYIRHDSYSEQARLQRDAVRSIAPVRGAIFDRSGRPLALSSRMYSVAVKPGEVRNRHKVAAALHKALGVSRSDVRGKLRSSSGFVYVERQCQLDEKVRASLAALPGVEVTTEQGRVYPFGALGAKVIGWVGVDNQGMAGVEATFESDLHGEPGLERIIKNGRYREDRYYRHVEKEPRDGRHVYLTIDATVQEIAENEIERAVTENGARGGVVAVMEVETGDILALAEYPTIATRRTSHADSIWTIRSLSHVYEPGSTFKIVSAAALLETHSVGTDDSYDAEDGDADLGFARIRDAHPHGMLTFAEAFAVSSNIVMAKASRSVDAETFYRFVREFGFGTRTGVDMIGESAGAVPPVENWSLRTQSTMAFGQEIAVTPLQMLNAMAAIANGGEMMMPRFVYAVSDDNGRTRHKSPVRVRRVVSRRTAGVLKELCRSVVTEGTGTAAGVDFLEVSGKTGTSQIASSRGYKQNKYVASFAGFAPHAHPRIAALVILEEPRWSARYGGESAAPVFARVCRAIANATDIFDEELAQDATLVKTEDTRGSAAPNFLRMDRATALEYARRIGANVLCQGEEGRVVAQAPDPGVPMDRDDVVRLFVSGAAAFEGTVPDLRGLSMREARRQAIQAGLRTRISGTGMVREQTPAPGSPSSRQVVRLYGDNCVAHPMGSSR